MNENISKKRFIYTMLEVTYNKKMQHLIKKDKREIYPAEWFSIKNYIFRKDVLQEALKKNILIKDTEMYKNRTEKVIK